MEPYFSLNDRLLFYKYLDNATFYFEFGSGGSTYQAAIRKNIKRVVSVESDINWHNKLKKLLTNFDNICFIYNEMDTRKNTFGKPGPNATEQQQINYSNQIIYLDKDLSQKLDFILIDGRFRVACCLKSFNVINNDCIICFDDFLKRKPYHIILKYFDIIDKTKDKRMVFLKKKSNIKLIPDELIKEYELRKL